MLFDEYISAENADRSAAMAGGVNTAAPQVLTVAIPLPTPSEPTSTALPTAVGGLPLAPRRFDAAGEVERHFPTAGVSVSGPFLAFYEHFGPTICGTPLTGEVMFEGRRIQVFEHLALEENAAGLVRPRALGAEWMARLADSDGHRSDGDTLQIIDLTDQLSSLGSGGTYETRPLADIRYLVIHHTGAPPEIGPVTIAEEHIEGNGWPGIGYHYVVGEDGTVWRTQDLTTISHHARQFSAVSVGIALAGDLIDAIPPPAQIDRAAALAAELLDELGLPVSAVRGHREMVETRCPGDAFMRVWRPRLLDAVRQRLGVVPSALPRV